ncbi:MAG TPA: TolC family protein [Thermoanaerobaculia bacterium]|nr:TolC family protein [Thermoanaerobaculia bacterium]
MSRWIQLAAGLVAVAIAPIGARAQPLTLRAATGEVLEKNPAMAAATARRDEAVAHLREARASWLPRIEASETVVRGDNPGFVFGSLLEQGRFSPAHFDPAFLNDPGALTNVRAGVTARLAVFDQFHRLDATKQAGNRVDRSNDASEETRQRMHAETIRAFYGLLVARDRRSVAENAERTAESDAKAMRDRFEQGLIVESDTLSADVQLAAFRQRRIEAEGEEAIAVAMLATLLQRPVVASIVVEGSLPEKTFSPSPLEAMIARGLTNRGDVRIAGSAADDARLAVHSARGSLLPRIDAFATWGASGTSVTGQNPDRAAGLVVSIDLFDGRKYARIGAARAAEATARAEAVMARDRVTMEIVTAWHRERAARERVAVAEAGVASATAAARIIRDRYENGLTTISEHLRAQTALVTSRLDLLESRFASTISYAELLRATGELHDVEDFHH